MFRRTKQNMEVEEKENLLPLFKLKLPYFDIIIHYSLFCIPIRLFVLHS